MWSFIYEEGFGTVGGRGERDGKGRRGEEKRKGEWSRSLGGKRLRMGRVSLKGAFASEYRSIAKGCLCSRGRVKVCLDTNKNGGKLGDYIFNRPEVLILFGLSPCY